jgi:DNA-directed RNA polymerase specialized sigma24 family protein
MGYKQDAEDLAQDVVMGYVSGKNPNTPVRWMLTHAIAHRNPAAKKLEVFGETLPEKSVEATAEDGLMIEQFLERLSPEQRAMFTLAHKYGYTYIEVGEIFGMGKTSVILRLKQCMAAFEAESESAV